MHSKRWLAILAGACFVAMQTGCSPKPKPVPKKAEQPKTPKKKELTAEELAAKKAKEAEAKKAFKPLAVRRLRRDPRSVLDKLEDAQVTVKRNLDGNVKAIHAKQLDDSLLEAISRLEQLEEVVASESAASPEAFKSLFDAVQLKTLSVKGREIRSLQLADISGQQKLKTLVLAGTRVDDEVLSQLEELPALERLELSWSRVTDEGVKSLGKVKRLEKLDLAYTDISDDSLETLQQMKSLKSLILSGTSISREAGDKLREALPNTRIIGLPSDGNIPPPPPDPAEPPAGLIET